MKFPFFNRKAASIEEKKSGTPNMKETKSGEETKPMNMKEFMGIVKDNQQVGEEEEGWVVADEEEVVVPASSVCSATFKSQRETPACSTPMVATAADVASHHSLQDLDSALASDKVDVRAGSKITKPDFPADAGWFGCMVTRHVP